MLTVKFSLLFSHTRPLHILNLDRPRPNCLRSWSKGQHNSRAGKRLSYRYKKS